MNASKIVMPFLFLLAIVSLTLFAFKPFVSLQEEWEVPAKYKSMENPAAGDDEAMEIGAELYAKHCKSCHGKTGLGDGPKSAELDTDCGDFSMEEFQQQTDGVLFYKTSFGRDDMPAFNKKISSDEDRWMIVTYLRSFEE